MVNYRCDHRELDSVNRASEKWNIFCVDMQQHQRECMKWEIVWKEFLHKFSVFSISTSVDITAYQHENVLFVWKCLSNNITQVYKTISIWWK